MPDDILKQLGSCIRRYRNERDLTQEQLSDKAGVSADDLFYTKQPDEEREVSQLTGYYKACPPDDRGLILKTVQCLAYELKDRSEATTEDEKA